MRFYSCQSTECQLEKTLSDLTDNIFFMQFNKNKFFLWHNSEVDHPPKCSVDYISSTHTCFRSEEKYIFVNLYEWLCIAVSFCQFQTCYCIGRYDNKFEIGNSLMVIIYIWWIQISSNVHFSSILFIIQTKKVKLNLICSVVLCAF